MTGRVLVLDQGYQPHRIVSWKRAVTMLFDGKIEVIEEFDEEIKSVNIVIKMPAVVRLLKAVSGRKRQVKFSRINLAIRDDFSCQYCGDKKTLKHLTYDHVVPRAKGGRTTWENIVMACRPCNSKKGHKTAEEVGLRLRTKPIKPKWLPANVFRIEDTRASVPEQWYNYLYWHGSLVEGS